MEPYKKGQNLLEGFVWPIDTGRLMGVGMALHFDYASARAPTSSKRPAPTATRGSSYTAPLPLRFLYSFNEVNE